MQDTSHRTRRIAKNTLMLYIRMLVLMLVGLYTSRVVLSALGESDYGVYNVVGGVVAMFTLFSGALSSAISRYITVELGKGNQGNLASVFSTSVIIQVITALLVAVMAEPAGLWFIENKMVIDTSRVEAAKWVLHFSVITFAINLISIPYNAAIVAYEKMGAFAYISIFEGLGKLAVALVMANSPADRLVMYSMLMCVLAVAVRVAYGIYCRYCLEGCRFSFTWNKGLLREMFAFAGWNTVGVASSVCKDQGVNILLNIFGGPVINAARAIAVQVNGVVYNFVRSFTTAINPQITKSYIAGDYDYMYRLTYDGARLSYYILLFLCLPLILQADQLLVLWLKDVPEYSAPFVQWTLACVMSESLSNPLMTVQLATGRIRNYQIVVGGLQLLNLPAAYILLKMGCSPVSVMVAAFVISQLCLFARLVMLRKMVGLHIMAYIKSVYAKVVYVTVAAALLPFIMDVVLPDSIWSLLCICVVSVLSVLVAVLYIGCSPEERKLVAGKVRGFLKTGGGNGRS